jgi:alkylation response protein AidB-like acyl-CoA dehydrogenase
MADRAAVALACDSLGVSEAMLDATVGYVRVREQFGRPVGSFQAVKHACADMLVQVSVGRQLVSAAVAQLAADDPGAGVAASMAKSFACASAVQVAGTAMQLHGGMGLHLGQWYPCVPQTRTAKPVAVRLASSARAVEGDGAVAGGCALPGGEGHCLRWVACPGRDPVASITLRVVAGEVGPRRARRRFVRRPG